MQVGTLSSSHPSFGLSVFFLYTATQQFHDEVAKVKEENNEREGWEEDGTHAATTQAKGSGAKIYTKTYIHSLRERERERERESERERAPNHKYVLKKQRFCELSSGMCVSV